MNKTPIEWCRTYLADGTFRAGHTVNPVRFRPAGSERLVTMCQKVSAGCAHCYAEGIGRRFWPKDALVPFPGYTAAGVASGAFELDEGMLARVLAHKGATRLFWGDMTDLFQDGVPDWMLDRIFAVCALTPHITHMFLTKRAERMQRYFSRSLLCGDLSFLVAGLIADHWMKVRKMPRGFEWSGMGDGKVRCAGGVAEGAGWPLPNVWLGVSVEDQAQADARISWLLRTPAAVRFLSCEPLLGAVRLEVAEVEQYQYGKMRWSRSALEAGDVWWDGEGDISDGPEYPALDWVIVGGESGGAKTVRPMHPDWARGLRDQCVAAGVPFFFKQCGKWEWGDPKRWYANPRSAGTVYGPFRPTCVGKGGDRRMMCRAYPAVIPGEIGKDVRSPVMVWEARAVGKKAAGALLDGREWRQFPGDDLRTQVLRSAQDDHRSAGNGSLSGAAGGVVELADGGALGVDAAAVRADGLVVADAAALRGGDGLAAERAGVAGAGDDGGEVEAASGHGESLAR